MDQYWHVCALCAIIVSLYRHHFGIQVFCFSLHLVCSNAIHHNSQSWCRNESWRCICWPFKKIKSKLCIRLYVARIGDPRANIENLDTLWFRANNLSLFSLRACTNGVEAGATFDQFFFNILNDIAFATVAPICNLQNEIAEKKWETPFFFFLYSHTKNALTNSPSIRIIRMQ